MMRRRAVHFVWLLLLSWLFLTALPGARASVDLSSFTISPGDGEVLLDWETGSELNFVGFYVRRSPQDDGDYGNWGRIQVIDRDNGQTVEFIPARDDFGALYHFRDPGVQNGVLACYALEAVNTDTGTTFYPSQPACVTPGPPATSTPTETSIPTQTPTATSTNTATFTPTTPAATATQGSPTPTLTYTPKATASPTSARAPTSTPLPSPTVTPTPALTATVAITQTFTPSPWPTFLPTRTATPTVTPTFTRTPTPTPTRGPLLAATAAPGTPLGRMAELAARADLTLGELVVVLTLLLALTGGLLFAGLLYMVQRWERS